MLLIELTDIPNESLLVYVVPVAELAIWLVAISVTLRVLWQLTHGAWRVIALCAIGPTLILALVWFANWSVFEPRSYFQLHRPGFTAIAQMVDNSGFPSPRTYYGQRLPAHLSDLATDGRASVVGQSSNGVPAVFVPQFLGIPDDAVGYVYLADERPDDVSMDLYGDVNQAVIDLGDGWCWVW